MSIRVVIASRMLSSWPTRPSGTAARACRALAMEAAMEAALVAGRGHELHELRERGGALRIRGLRLPDVDEPAADDQPLADGVEQVPGSRDDVVRAPDVGRGGREHPGDRHERIIREEAFEALEAPARRDQVGVERVHRRPVDVQAGLADAVHHRLEVGPQRPRLVERRQVSEGSQGGAQDQEEQDGCGDAAHHHPPPGSCASRRSRPRGHANLAHGAGSAMTMNRGEVGWYEVDVCSVSCSADVGSVYFIASHGTFGRTWSTT